LAIGCSQEVSFVCLALVAVVAGTLFASFFSLLMADIATTTVFAADVF
jgi:hypothetical protein